MKKHTKKILSVICIALVVTLLGGYVAWKNYIPTEIQYMLSGDTTVNLGDPREVVGVKDYVFVGYVQEIHDYHTEKSSRDFPEIVSYYQLPFTECQVKIIASIKGELEEGNEFSFYKVGGIVESRSCILLLEKDIIDESNIEESKIYQTYLDAYENQIPPDIESSYPDFLCTADKNYDDGTYNAELYEDYAKMKKEKGTFDENLDKAVKKGNKKIK